MRAVQILRHAKAPFVFAVLLLMPGLLKADSTKYPQFAQQTLAQDVKPEFISVDALAAELKKGAKPLIIDVRSSEEFKEVHISDAISAPLDHFRDHIKSIPRERVTILY